MTERFKNPECHCQTYEGNLGPCLTYEQGASGACVYCEHNLDCHQSLLGEWCRRFLKNLLGRPAFPPDIETLMRRIAEVRRAAVAQTWADAIAFIEGGSFLHDAAPTALFAKECAKAMRDRGPPRALAPTAKEPT